MTILCRSLGQTRELSVLRRHNLPRARTKRVCEDFCMVGTLLNIWNGNLDSPRRSCRYVVRPEPGRPDHACQLYELQLGRMHLKKRSCSGTSAWPFCQSVHYALHSNAYRERGDACIICPARVPNEPSRQNSRIHISYIVHEAANAVVYPNSHVALARRYLQPILVAI